MFTGLVETTGKVQEVQPTTGAVRLIIVAPGLHGRWKTGDSVAVNGVCLTALPVQAPGEDSTGFAADLAQETLDRTSLQHLALGSVVNLELPTPAGAPLGGHVVQGHVDGTATVVSMVALYPEDPKATDWRLTLDLPASLAAHVISQGSITVDGISLTVAKLTANHHGTRIEIAIIPHTYAATNLHTLQPGARVNIETDVLAKYAAQQATAAPPHEWLTPAYLMTHGY